MKAIETIEKIMETNLIYEDLKYCFVNSTKLPFRWDGTIASSNNLSDFVSFSEILKSEHILEFDGIGISVQASEICAVDIDKCVTTPFDKNSINEFGLGIINIFKDFAYIEFSFSGTGIRILFKHNLVENYQEQYKIKNSSSGLEFYQYTMAGRYVTVTGRYLYNNPLKSNEDHEEVIIDFLDEYMKRTVTKRKQEIIIEDKRTDEELRKLVKRHLFKSQSFQDLWFTKAPGSGKDESERDFYLIKYIYENITQDREKLKSIFEESDFYKSKDNKHINKWKRNDHWYFNYVYDNVKG